MHCSMSCRVGNTHTACWSPLDSWDVVQNWKSSCKYLVSGLLCLLLLEAICFPTHLSNAPWENQPVDSLAFYIRVKYWCGAWISWLLTIVTEMVMTMSVVWCMCGCYPVWALPWDNARTYSTLFQSLLSGQQWWHSQLYSVQLCLSFGMTVTVLYIWIPLFSKQSPDTCSWFFGITTPHCG